jgi:Spy/CpxP family protein refolding chaperone
MKAHPLFLFLAGATLAISPLQTVRADDSSTQTDNTGDLSAGAPSTGSQSGAEPGERGGKWREAFARLGLSDTQKAQIRQIRASTSPGKERRQQIMAVLTPDQKEKLRQMVQSYKAQNGT